MEVTFDTKAALGKISARKSVNVTNAPEPKPKPKKTAGGCCG
jgi:hypothetical protein